MKKQLFCKKREGNYGGMGVDGYSVWTTIV